jgi:phosphoesterase RecJ-like protein
MSQLVATIVKKISEAKRLLLVTHVFPDGDNLGSALALLQALRTLGKEVRFYLSGDVPRVYQWLPSSGEIEDSLPAKSGAPWTVIALDSGDPSRMGDDFVSWYDSSSLLINIDHHTSNSQFGHINWVDPDYSSTAEMVIEITDALGVELTADMATCIFCAIYTDTGRFSYSNTNYRSLSVAARCVGAGAVPHESYSSVYASRTLAGLKLLTRALETLRFFADSTGCAFHIDKEMFSETGTDVSDTEGFMETVTQVMRFKIIVFFKEVAPGVIKASLRCREPVNASELAGRFNGGGHPRAAGFSLEGSIEESYTKFIAEAEKYLAAVER